MLYRISTNVGSPRFNIYLLDRGRPKELLFSEYQDLADISQDDPGIDGVKVWALPNGIDPDKLSENENLVTFDERKEPDPKKVPDFWTAAPVPLVTQAFKDYVEEVDPNVHQFIPIKLYNFKTNEPYVHTQFYRMVCCRLLEIELHSEEIVEGGSPETGMTDASLGRASRDGFRQESYCLRTIVERPDIQDFVGALPLWKFKFAGGDDVFYCNESFFKDVKKRKFVGFKETKGIDRKDVCHVWY
ncbi:MAG: DUF1629 domain-containing protein [Pseudomonadota bacterium]